MLTCLYKKKKIADKVIERGREGERKRERADELGTSMRSEIYIYTYICRGKKRERERKDIDQPKGHHPVSEE